MTPKISVASQQVTSHTLPIPIMDQLCFCFVAPHPMNSADRVDHILDTVGLMVKGLYIEHHSSISSRSDIISLLSTFTWPKKVTWALPNLIVWGTYNPLSKRGANIYRYHCNRRVYFLLRDVEET